MLNFFFKIPILIQVLAFTNLTLDQMRNAVKLFASFVDEETYALFYYGGHAVGFNEVSQPIKWGISYFCLFLDKKKSLRIVLSVHSVSLK